MKLPDPTLERLLIDSAVGALDGDTSALLNAYLDDHPDATTAAQELADTAALARRAMDESDPVVLPPFPRQRLIRARRAQRLWTTARYGSAIAAGLLIGLTLSITLTQRTESRPPVRPIAFQPVITAPLVEDDKDSFWSVERWYEQVKRDRPAQPARRWIWDSVTSPPRLGDES